MNGPTRGEDVFIPMDWIIGGQERAGQGGRMLMNCLAAGRSISLPAASTGAAKLCARTTGAYARVRKQFRIPVGRFEGVQEATARIAGTAYQLEAMRRVQESGNLSLLIEGGGREQASDEDSAVVLVVGEPTPEIEDDLRFIRETLGLQPRSGGVRISYGGLASSPNEIAVLSRSAASDHARWEGRASFVRFACRE